MLHIFSEAGSLVILSCLIKLSYRQVFLLNILKNNKTQEEYTFRMIFNIVLFA